eukprot:2624848-Rhodomonas_salina.2
MHESLQDRRKRRVLSSEQNGCCQRVKVRSGLLEKTVAANRVQNSPHIGGAGGNGGQGLGEMGLSKKGYSREGGRSSGRLDAAREELRIHGS